jgi:NADPH-dependent curcumin reductase CurA
MVASREIRLKRRLVGAPIADNFELATVSVPAPALGEVQVKNLWMSVDPYMRGRMVDRTSYDPQFALGEATPAREIGEVAASNSTMYGWRPPFQLGEALQGGAVGEVVASEDPGFKPGDLVSSMFGWRERFNAPARTVEKLDTLGLLPGRRRCDGSDSLGRPFEDRRAQVWRCGVCLGRGWCCWVGRLPDCQA